VGIPKQQAMYRHTSIPTNKEMKTGKFLRMCILYSIFGIPASPLPWNELYKAVSVMYMNLSSLPLGNFPSKVTGKSRDSDRCWGGGCLFRMTRQKQESLQLSS